MDCSNFASHANYKTEPLSPNNVVKENGAILMSFTCINSPSFVISDSCVDEVHVMSECVHVSEHA